VKLTNAGNVSRGDVLASRRNLVIKRGRGGQLHAEAWPRRRGKNQTPIERAWVNDFSSSAKRSKDPDPCAAATAMPMVKGTGFYYRDILEFADHGKLISTSGREPNPVMLLAKKYQGMFRVLTPTASVYRDTTEPLTSGVLRLLTPNIQRWDNNAFWNAVTNPTRLTVQSAGLYSIGCTVGFNSVNGGNRQIFLLVNGTTQVSEFRLPIASAQSTALSITGLWPFNAGDYVEVQVFANVASVNAQLREFWILAITPETLV